MKKLNKMQINYNTMISSKIRDLQKRNKVTIEELATGVGMTKNGLYLALKNGDFKVSTLEKIASYFGKSVIYFFDSTPLEPFGEGMESAKEGATLGGRLRVLGANLEKAADWQARVEGVAHENEELKAMVESMQRTIQAHEATIEALRENIKLLKEKRG